jgi:hypothetical protein
MDDPVTPLRDVRLDKVSSKPPYVTVVITPSTTLDVVVSVNKNTSSSGSSSNSSSSSSSRNATRVYTIA